MPNPVVIEFLMKGIPNIAAGIRNVEDIVTKAERASTRASQRAAGQRKAITDGEARMRVQAMLRADREVKKAQTAAARETDLAAKQELRRVEHTAREKVRIMMRADQELKRARSQAAREVAANEKRANAESSKWVKKREKEQRLEQIEAYHNRRRFIQHIGGAAGHGVAQGATRVASVAKGVAGMVSGLGGGFSLGDSVQRSISLRGKLADIASRDVDPSDKTKTRKSTASLESTVRGATQPYGIDSDAGAEALDKFASKTGELQKGMDMLKGLAELSRAGAGSIDDLADAAGDIFNADKSQSAEAVLQKLRQFAIQGQKGAVEMKDLASQMAKIGAAAGRFEGGADKNLLTMGALVQGARESGGAASAAEATTSVSALSNQFYKNARLDKMHALGVNPKTAEGYNKPVEEVIFDLMRGAEKKSRAKGGGLQNFDELMGSAIASSEARKATSPLEAAFKAAGGGEAGIDAAKKQLSKFGAGDRDLKKEFAGKAADRMTEVDAKVAVTAQRLDEAVATKIIPKLLELMPAIEKMIPDMVDLAGKGIPAFVDLIKTVAKFAESNKGTIDFIASHPIGAIMVAEVTKSVASAQIGEAFKMIIQKALGAPGAGGGGGGGAGGAAGLGTFGGQRVGGAIGLGIAGGLAVNSVITDAMTGYAGGEERGQDVAAKVRAYGRGDRSDRSMSPAAAQAELDAAKERLAKNGGVLSTTGNLLGSLVGNGAADKDYKQTKSDQGLTDSEELKKALLEVAGAMRANTTAQKEKGSTGPNGAARDTSIIARP